MAYAPLPLDTDNAIIPLKKRVMERSHDPLASLVRLVRRNGSR